MWSNYHQTLADLASGQLTVDATLHPSLSRRVDDVRDWCARLNMPEKPEVMLHDRCGPDIEAWILGGGHTL